MLTRPCCVLGVAVERCRRGDPRILLSIDTPNWHRNMKGEIVEQQEPQAALQQQQQQQRRRKVLTYSLIAGGVALVAAAIALGLVFGLKHNGSAAPAAPAPCMPLTGTQATAVSYAAFAAAAPSHCDQISSPADPAQYGVTPTSVCSMVRRGVRGTKAMRWLAQSVGGGGGAPKWLSIRASPPCTRRQTPTARRPWTWSSRTSRPARAPSPWTAPWRCPSRATCPRCWPRAQQVWGGRRGVVGTTGDGPGMRRGLCGGGNGVLRRPSA